MNRKTLKKANELNDQKKIIISILEEDIVNITFNIRTKIILDQRMSQFPISLYSSLDYDLFNKIINVVREDLILELDIIEKQLEKI